jgi:GntR family transcriptional regulator
MLPTEEKLAKQFRVSRMTIREALKSFEEDGLIVRRARVGTWLARPVPLALDRRFTGPIENFGRLGTPTRTVLVSRAYINPPAEIAAVLRVSNKKKILEVRRLRFAEDQPLLLLKAYFSPSLGKKAVSISKADSLYVPVLRAMHDPDIHEELQQIDAITIDDTLSRLLQVRTGAPALVVKRLFVDSKGQPIVYFIAIFRADRYYYTVKLPRRKKIGGRNGPRS